MLVKIMAIPCLLPISSNIFTEFVVIDAVTLVEGQGDEPLHLTVDLSTYYRLPPNAS